MGDQGPESGFLGRRYALHLHGGHLMPAQVRATWHPTVDSMAYVRHRVAGSRGQHPSRSTALLTTLQSPVGSGRAPPPRLLLQNLAVAVKPAPNEPTEPFVRLVHGRRDSQRSPRG